MLVSVTKCDLSDWVARADVRGNHSTVTRWNLEALKKYVKWSGVEERKRDCPFTCFMCHCLNGMYDSRTDVKFLRRQGVDVWVN